MTTDTNNGTERRKNISYDHIMEKLLVQDDVISSNSNNIKSIADSLKRIEEDVRPIKEIMTDVATVGKIGRFFGKGIIWVGAVIAAITAIWYSLGDEI